MKVVATDKIRDAQQQYPAAMEHILGWYQVLTLGDFRSDFELKNTFGNIRSFNHEYHFPIPETKLFITALINFESQVALIENINSGS